jgi:hypothetical protein
VYAHFTILLLLAAAPPAPVDFDTDVLPVLAKAGCNAGACHGAAAGRGGFKLSLFGGDPAADHRAIVRDLGGRRVNLAHPDRSLILLKPTWQLDHGGGERFAADSPQTKLLTDWIAAGAPRKPTRQLISLAVEPANPALDSLPGRLSLAVTARFDDGTTRRVEDLALYTPADPAATKVDEHGGIDVVRPGRHAIVVRFLTQVKAIQVTAAYPAEPLAPASLARHNWIDDEVNDTLTALRLPPAPQADDAALLRRITLDLTGHLPSPDQVREFLANADPNKFATEVERLFATPEFVEYWTYRLADWLHYDNSPREPESRQVYYAWLQQQIAERSPLNQVVTDLIRASGDSHQDGPVNFHRSAGDARAEAEQVAETLLAVRLRCANCHNHPLDRWTQDDYHGLAAIFARLDRGQVVGFRPTGEVVHPATGEAALPRIPGEKFLGREIDGRAVLAEWLTAKDNRQFARAWVNRMWQALMGRGLVEPVDDLRDTNPATHPTLLDRLAVDFSKHDFDLRHTLSLIVSSATYQRSNSPLSPTGRGVGGEGERSPRDDRFYSQALSRQIPTPILIRLICQTTEVPGELFDEARAKDDDGQKLQSLLSGYPLGVAACEARKSDRDGQLYTPTGPSDLSGELQWLNGPLLNRKLADPRSAFFKIAVSRLPKGRLVEEYYLRTVSRLPTPAELKFWEGELVGSDRGKRCEDFAWSLLSCPEFVTNH